MTGKTLIKCNASTPTGGVNFYRVIKRGTLVDVVEVLPDRVLFTVPGYRSIVECWRPDLITVQED